MATIILSFLAGLGITIFLLYAIFATVISCAGLIAIVRAAINTELGNFAKIVWIIFCFIPGVGLLYFAFVDKNAFLKFTGWACIVFFVLIGVTGGAAMQNAVKSYEDHNGFHEWTFEESYPPQPAQKNPEKEPEKDEAPDDSSLSL